MPLSFRRAAPVATAYALGALAAVSLLAFNVATIALCIWAVPCVICTVAMRAPTGARRSVIVAALVSSVIFGFTSRRSGWPRPTRPGTRGARARAPRPC
ncbi:hypothetical protein M3B14_08920 [Kocuria marina]|uniref:hypothetical protein n=1 Tax=Kocuria marina TaxID=223184 RepID=UPI002989A369|nr:hypothetical protein [Kocuria marina]MCT1723719.1 hypothetical protein [Kocuria marina]MCT1734558.1 hypothetical protein [Kocuria marina]